MELYEGHYENAVKASKLGLAIIKENRESIKQEYILSPNKCLNCNEDLDYNKKNNKFCSSSCAASYNNKKRGKLGDIVKQKISKALIGRKLSIDQRQKRIKKNSLIMAEKNALCAEKHLKKED